MNLPKHINATISHNPHNAYYQTVREYLDDVCPLVDEDDFESPEDMQECIDNDELWTLQIYPDTPIGFWSIGAPTFEALIEFAGKVDR